jgi:hypothetical protein
MPHSPGPQSQIFLYTELFKFSSAHKVDVDGVDVFAPAPDIDMFLLHRHLRSNGTRMGDTARLIDVREVVELVPRYGAKMDGRLNSDTSLEFSDSFYMNNFADKETFHAILSYQ